MNVEFGYYLFNFIYLTDIFLGNFIIYTSAYSSIYFQLHLKKEYTLRIQHKTGYTERKSQRETETRRCFSAAKIR